MRHSTPSESAARHNTAWHQTAAGSSAAAGDVAVELRQELTAAYMQERITQARELTLKVMDWFAASLGADVVENERAIIEAWHEHCGQR